MILRESDLIHCQDCSDDFRCCRCGRSAEDIASVSTVRRELGRDRDQTISPRESTGRSAAGQLAVGTSVLAEKGEACERCGGGGDLGVLARLRPRSHRPHPGGAA